MSSMGKKSDSVLESKGYTKIFRMIRIYGYFVSHLLALGVRIHK